VVLDRPNPLGGEKVEGCCVEDGFYSFVGMFAIPYVYGLTVGEVATLINEEGLNKGIKGNEDPLKCKLSVVPMEGWHRRMTYEDTGLPWVLPSASIPFVRSAADYPSSGLIGELEFLETGLHYSLPFQTFAQEWIDADKLLEKLQSYNLPGVSFRTIHYRPFFGSDKRKTIHGVQFFYTDYPKAYITLTQFYVLQALHELYPDRNPFDARKIRLASFDIACGTNYVREQFQKRFLVEDIIDWWTKDDASFRKLSSKYYLYD